MGRLYKSLGNKYRDVEGFQVYMPPNTELVKRDYKIEYCLKAIGKAAESSIRDMQERVHRMTGVLVEGNNFTYSLYAPEQLESYAGIGSYEIMQREHAPYRSSFDVLKRCLELMYESVRVVKPSEYCQTLSRQSRRTSIAALSVNNAVTVVHFPPDRILLEWAADPISDMTADSILAVTAQAEISPFNLQLTSHSCAHDHHESTCTETATASEEEHPSGQSAAPTESNSPPLEPRRSANSDHSIDGTPLNVSKLQYSVLMRVLRDYYGNDNVEESGSGSSNGIRVTIDDVIAEVNPQTFEITDIRVDGNVEKGEQIKEDEEKLANVLEHVKDATLPLS
eukprot:gb/GECG01014713.1/.p1 GENE.gb/GECG01014713.1/~~gb/GECG01014713.1/.p1  ORF type:complete len:338 (+),score=43.26 gb/GECG01014713.1/:1-1014(+)